MILCLDSNVFDGIAEQHSTKRLAAWLRRRGYVVSLADQVVGEAARIPDASKRARHIRAILDLASEVPRRSDSYVTTMEVRDEMRRLHPEWMASTPELSDMNSLIHHRLHFLRQLRLHPSLEFDPEYALTVHSAVGSLKRAQQDRRRMILTMPELKLELTTVGGEASESQLGWFNSLAEPDKYWRNRSRSLWRRALLGAPEMRDYADWLEPYVTDVPPEPAWSEFWLFEVSAENVRRDQTIGVCEYYQVFEKIGAGNAGDMLLAAHLLDTDVLITADVQFYRVLGKVVNSHGPFKAIPVLVDRGADDFVHAVKVAITSVAGRLSPA